MPGIVTLHETYLQFLLCYQQFFSSQTVGFEKGIQPTVSVLDTVVPLLRLYLFKTVYVVNTAFSGQFYSWQGLSVLSQHVTDSLSLVFYPDVVSV